MYTYFGCRLGRQLISNPVLKLIKGKNICNKIIFVWFITEASIALYGALLLTHAKTGMPFWFVALANEPMYSPRRVCLCM